MQLRDYQQRAIDQLYSWFNSNSEGHPCLAMPGGSGKSVVIAAIVRDALQNWPQTRVLMLVHSKELIQQNHNKLLSVWRNAPAGVYSAALNKREMGYPITYAGIGSVAKRAHEIGHIDLCIVDEAHSISNSESGMYRKLLSDLFAINPAMRIIGLTASPYRLGQGLVTEGEHALFTDIIEPVTIEELIYKKHLYPLRSKFTDHKLSVEGLHKRQGDYIASEMEQAFNTQDHNKSIVSEIIYRGKDHRHWLIFCSGINHSEDVAAEFTRQGIPAESLSGKMGKKERERKIADFESGKIRALCNVGILTTGYDFPDLDLIAFLRATESPGLYLQMAVRGSRIKSHTDHCLVLDFVGNVARHGPITALQPPKSKGKGGEAPTKKCPVCAEVLLAFARECPVCGHVFTAEKEEPKLSNLDIMGFEAETVAVRSWQWRVHVSRNSGKEMLKVTYYPDDMMMQPITEYLPIMHGGYAEQKAVQLLTTIAHQSGIDDYKNRLQSIYDLDSLAEFMQEGNSPTTIDYKRDGKFYRVITRTFEKPADDYARGLDIPQGADAGRRTPDSQGAFV